jgi:hypothetical protein
MATQRERHGAAHVGVGEASGPERPGGDSTHPVATAPTGRWPHPAICVLHIHVPGISSGIVQGALRFLKQAPAYTGPCVGIYRSHQLSSTRRS